MTTDTKYELTWLNGDTTDIFDTLEEAKREVDNYRQSHELDYGLIRTIRGCGGWTMIDDNGCWVRTGERGEWNEFSEDWEEEAKIEFDTDKMDQALNDDGLDWTLDEPTDDTKYVCVYVIKK